jgi:hypothetical protein
MVDKISDFIGFRVIKNFTEKTKKEDWKFIFQHNEEWAKNSENFLFEICNFQ